MLLKWIVYLEWNSICHVTYITCNICDLRPFCSKLLVDDKHKQIAVVHSVRTNVLYRIIWKNDRVWSVWGQRNISSVSAILKPSYLCWDQNCIFYCIFGLPDLLFYERKEVCVGYKSASKIQSLQRSGVFSLLMEMSVLIL